MHPIIVQDLWVALSGSGAYLRWSALWDRCTFIYMYSRSVLKERNREKKASWSRYCIAAQITTNNRSINISDTYIIILSISTPNWYRPYYTCGLIWLTWHNIITCRVRSEIRCLIESNTGRTNAVTAPRQALKVPRQGYTTWLHQTRGPCGRLGGHSV